MILVVAEQRSGVLNRATWEAIAAAQRLADGTGGGPLEVALVGAAGAAAQELAAAGVGDVLVLNDPALDLYTPDGYVAALAAMIASRAPEFVVLPHTYQTRDFVPALAARLNKPLVTDVTAISGATFTRPMFQGKLAAEVRPAGGRPCFVTCQIGAFRADHVRKGASPSEVTRAAVAVDPRAIRQTPEAPFQEAQQAVDLSQAARIVAVGRGIKSREQLPVAESLARALGAELAASRPICDSGWLPMERQIGSSGQTVAPKLYVALGISGAIQHLVGMKGSRTIVAINKDADAPIFEVADYGIVGDLFEIVPALVAELEKPS
ncbi:MAG: electron transfer flavoprotein subunit alpha [Acidobacteria bacterium RIFCSPLOWO2_02_FULL_68_18]|nr:MAG: electron transfer flavoprotein subunit alpha [Acidobacteria bacterium RIFCSPLOWO2_02_FULL_68_18]OFW49973.1 MAG: electron transfer flavoprotein subunit alpha [Acidobacteria bacterium RIFCSPLOWO2_12_FULL_68_19]